MSKTVVFLIGVAIGVVLGRLTTTDSGKVAPGVRVLTRIDTVVVEKPAPAAEIILPAKIVRLPLVGTPDSAEVEVPRKAVTYSGESYRAVVSGFDVRLDTLEMRQRELSVSAGALPVRGTVPTKRFSVGIQAGYGLTPRGFQPYIGVGVSFRL